MNLVETTQSEGSNAAKIYNKNNVDVYNAGWLFIIKEDVDRTPLGQYYMPFKVWDWSIYINMDHGWLFLLIYLQYAIFYLATSCRRKGISYIIVDSHTEHNHRKDH